MTDLNNILPEELQVVEEFPRNCFTRNAKDQTLLVAKGKFYGASYEEKAKAKSEHINKLANTIIKVISKLGDVRVRAIGDRANSCAAEAIARATRKCQKESNIELLWKIELDVGNIGELRDPTHVQNVEAMQYQLSGFKKIKE